MSKAKRQGLGRSFESLIPTDLLDESFDITSSEDKKVTDLKNIPLDKVVPDPDQPRRDFDDKGLEDLAASIKEHGVLQPIVVVKSGTNNYKIVAGERRYRASKMANMPTIPALIRSLSSQNRLEVSLIENLQRRNLNAIETATAYLKLRDQFNLSLEKIGERVGDRSISSVSNTLRLLKLPKSIQKLVVSGQISEGQVRPLIGLDEKLAEEISAEIIKYDWSARRAERYVSDLKAASKKTLATVKETPLQKSYNKKATSLELKFKTEVKVKSNAKGAGSLVIKFKNQEEFNRITELL